MRIALAILLLASQAYGAGFCLIRRNPPPLPRAYVTEGLTHYWDGEFNVSRTGHDADTLVWKDLVGTNDLTRLPHELLTFTAHSAKFGYTSYWSPKRTGGMFVGTTIPDSEIATVEVCACFQKGYGDSSVGECNVMFSNGATTRDYRSSQLGDKYCGAPYFYTLTFAYSATHLGSIARTASNGYVGYTRWNLGGNKGEGTGATFQDYTSAGFTISGCVTNRTDAGGSITAHYWRPDTLANYWGYYRDMPYTNNYVYTTGSHSSPYYTPVDPVGTGMSVGGVRFNGGQYSLFYGYIYAIRVYNRRLTMEERARNAAIDSAAFRGKKE